MHRAVIWTVLLHFVIATTTARQPACPIEIRPALRPDPRLDHAAAFDPTRGEMIVFGGARSPSTEFLYGDTWRHDGACWTLVSKSGPSPRRGHALAADPVRGVLVLYGGRDDAGLLTDTWEFDGSAWEQVNVAGSDPGARAGHSLVYDAARAAVVLVGDGATYQWDGSEWTQIADPLGGAGEWVMFADESRGELIALDTTRTLETRRLVGTQWELVTTIGPGFARGAQVCWDAGRGRAVLAGAEGTSGDGTTWEWDGSIWRLVGTAGPKRTDASLVYDAARGRCVLFGGQAGVGAGGAGGGGGAAGELWTWSGQAWSTGDTVPPSRAEHVLWADPTAGTLLLYGGSADFVDPDSFDATWERSGSGWSRRPGLGIGPVSNAAAVHDPLRNVSVLVGGHHEGNPVGTWERRGQRWAEIDTAPTNQPGPAAWHALLGGVLLVDRASGCDRAWLWDGQFWSPIDGDPVLCQVGDLVADSLHGTTVYFGASGMVERLPGGWVELPDKTARPLFTGGVQVAYEPVSDSFIAYGRVNGTPETWQFRRATGWSLLRSGYPEVVTSYDMARDPGSGAIVLVGGRLANQSIPEEAIWVWRDGDWRLETTSRPAARIHPVLQHDPVRDEVLLFGGDNGVQSAAPRYFDDTWLLRDGKWLRVDAGGPSARSRAAYCRRPDTGAILVYGGFGPSGEENDLWEWSGTGWDLLIPASPAAPPSDGARLIWDPRREAVVCYARDGAYVLNGAAWSAPEPLPFSPYFGAEAVFDETRGAPVVLEGFVGGLWVQEGLDPNDWRNLNTFTPILFGRMLYSAALGRPILVGGDVDGTALYTLDPNEAWVRPPILEPAPARAYPGITLDPFRHEVLLLDGRIESIGTVAGAGILHLGVAAGDLDGDGRAGLSDLAIVLGAFNAGPGGDLDGDGQTTLSDLARLLSVFGKGCP